MVSVARSVESEPPKNSPDWRFVGRPFWLFSHLFALAMVSLFVVLGFWQLDRLDQRRAENQVIEARTAMEPLIIDAEPSTGDDLEFRPAVVIGKVVDVDVARVANRSQGGVAGEHVVAIIELADGTLMAVNRGFAPVNADVDLTVLPTGNGGGPVRLSGWLRNSVEPEGWFAVGDTGEGALMPRLDTSALARRLDESVFPVWLQFDGGVEDNGGRVRFPDPVPLPELGEGPHLSYAGQWFIFALLGTGMYLATVRRRAHQKPSDGPIETSRT